MNTVSPPLMTAPDLRWMGLIASEMVLDEAYRGHSDRRKSLRHMVCNVGEVRPVERSIKLICTISWLMGVLYLRPLNAEMKRLGLSCVRYMDDWVNPTRTRWQLRPAFQPVNSILDDLKLEEHPDTMSMGRIDRRFDFLLYRFTVNGLRLAAHAKKGGVSNGCPGLSSTVRTISPFGNAIGTENGGLGGACDCAERDAAITLL